MNDDEKFKKLFIESLHTVPDHIKNQEDCMKAANFLYEFSELVSKTQYSDKRTVKGLTPEQKDKLFKKYATVTSDLISKYTDFVTETAQFLEDNGSKLNLHVIRSLSQGIPISIHWLHDTIKLYSALTELMNKY